MVKKPPVFIILHDSQSFQTAQYEDNIILRINQILIIKIIQIQRITGYGC